MWRFQPMPEPELYATAVTWQSIPFQSQYQDGSAVCKLDYPHWSKNVAKKFMLYRSLFDLVNSVYCLELEDKRLLTWFSSLSNEDRKVIHDEGGLHQFLLNHPALDIAKPIGIVHVKPQIRRAAEEIASQLNKSRLPAFHGVSRCKKCGTSCPSGSETCRTCFVHSPAVEERMYLTEQKGGATVIPRDAKEDRNMLTSSLGAPGDHQVAQGGFQSALDDSRTSLTSPGPRGGARFSKEWREGRSSVQSVTTSAFKDTSVQASFSLDMELESHSKMAEGSSPPAYPVLQTQFRNVTDNRSCLDLQKETPPEYHSFHSSLSTEQASVDSLMATRGSTENSLMTPTAGLFPSEISVSCQKYPSEWTNLDTNSLQKKTRDNCIMKESVNSEPWLNCSVTPEKPHASPSQKPHVDLPLKLDIKKSLQTPSRDEQSMAESFMSISPDKSGVLMPVSAAPATVNQMVDASGDLRARFTSTQECVAAPRTTDASTEMDSPMCFDQDTQTSQASTADKSVITEVHMADLNYLTKEFLRLKSVEEELEQLKASQLDSNNTKCGCECGQRLQQAELKLLALQYSMCQDHCWRRYYTSVQGESQLQCTGGVPESLAETLRALEQDYIQLRRQVLSGIALDELNPLSVDTQRLHIEAPYTPAQKINEYLEDESPLEFQSHLHSETEDTQKHFNSLEGERPATNIKSQKDAPGKHAVPHTKPGGVKSSKMVSVKTQKSDPSHGSTRPGGGEGVNVTSEAWYDAEEELGAAGQSLKEERLRKATESERNRKVEDGDGVSSSGHLHVTDFHQDVTEEDLFLAFKKCQPRDVCFTMSDKSRSGKVTVSSPENAVAAARELSGTSIHGQPVQVRRVSRLPAAGPEGEHTFKKPHVPSAPTPAPSGDVAKLGGVKTSTPYNMSPKPVRCLIEKLLNISDVPTATGTYVPQQPPTNTTTVTFGTLMRQLSELHPSVAREKIVEALLELRTQHRGSLNCLSLCTLVEMTSKLLSAQASDSVKKG
ncbi:RNA-binding protein 44-like isoform X2 [Alosa sapidissima]|uniref:RNA-binding protein 44-like isoform X2 n=1 Tax=Alosa sapidissima TaxID=34773 RepID=UPI001C09CCBE|nr:RNA-binding protein 44-like isoform X2 [Alosa sapidissima]